MKQHGREPFGKAAIIVACIALVIGAAGGAVAAKKGKKVKLKNGSVTTQKLADNAVTSPKLADSAVTKAKIADKAVGANKLGTIQTRSLQLVVPANNSGAVTVPCLATEVPISGGAAYVVTDANADIAIRSSFMVPAENGWRVAVKNSTAAQQTYNVEAYCLEK